MSNETRLSNQGIGLTILIAIPIGILLCIIIMPEILSPYMDACYTLASNVHELSPIECVQYMEANPGATGQDVVDYETSLTKIDELLNNPLEPSG